MAQTFTDFELIIVDDGSTDGSHELCEEFAKQDSRVRLITQPNRGLSAARNIGLLNSNGEYINFIDTDDRVDANYLQVLYDQLINNDADISMINYWLEKPDGTCLTYLSPQDIGVEVLGPFEAAERQYRWNLNTNIFVVAWGKLIRRSILIGEQFPIGRDHEDEAVIHRLFLKSRKVVLINKGYYYYRQHASSIMSNVTDERLMDFISAIEVKYADLSVAGCDLTNFWEHYLPVIADKLRLLDMKGEMGQGSWRARQLIEIFNQSRGKGNEN